MKYKTLQVEYLANGFIFVALQCRPAWSFWAMLFGRPPRERVEYFSGCQGVWFFYPDELPVFDRRLVEVLDGVKREWEAEKVK